MPLFNPVPPCQPLATGQTTRYNALDDAGQELGRTPSIAKAYTIYTAGQFSGTTNVDVPAYAANTISFNETGGVYTVADSANGLAIFKTGDVIPILGSGQDKVVTVASGNNAASFTTTEALVDEAAGAYITLFKRGAMSNNVVLDNNTQIMWLRDPSSTPGKWGAASDGKLLWTATLCTLHPAGADLQMLNCSKGTATLRIVGGAGEVLRYHANHGIVQTGFANAVCNLPGYSIVSVTVNGADLDIVLNTGNETCVAEAAGGSRTISVACNGIFCFAKACNAAAVGGYSDWVVPDHTVLVSILGQLLGGKPNATAFPNCVNQQVIYSSTTASGAGMTGYAFYVYWYENSSSQSRGGNTAKNTANTVMLCRRA